MSKFENLDVLIVNNWGSNPNPRTQFLSTFLNKNGINTMLLGRKNNIISESDDYLALDFPFNRASTFIKKRFLVHLIRFYIFFHSLRIILKLRPKYVYARDTYLSFLLILLSKIVPFKLVHESHGFLYKELMAKGSSHLINFYRLLYSYVLKESGFIVAITESLANNIKSEIKNSNVVLIPNGVSLNELDQKKRLTSYEPNISAKIVGFVGNWEKWIEIEDLLKASNYLDNNYQIVVIGEGDGLKSYRKKYDKVFFTGKIPHDYAISLMKAFDVCISPWSSQKIFEEKSARKTFEYLAMGKPIIVSDVLGKEPFLINKIHCLTYISKNPKDLAKKIVSIFHQDFDINSMIEENRNLSKNYDWKIIFENSGITELLKSK